jgi:hypothetical protein
MEILNILTQAFIFLIFPFVFSFLIGGNKFSSFVCTMFIAVTSFYNFNIFSMALFINYLMMDLIFRSEKIPVYMIWHHVIAGCLTLIGLHLNLILKTLFYSPILILIASHLLRMEVTTPLLHAAKYFDETKQNFEGLFVLFCLLVLWIPYRIIGPLNSVFLLQSLLQIDTLDNFTKNCLISVYVLIFMLFAFQIVWFYKLCVVIQKKFLDYDTNLKTTNKNNGKEKL